MCSSDLRWSSLDRGVQVNLSQPYLFSPHFSEQVEAQRWLTYAPAYHSEVTGGRLSVTRGSPASSWSVAATGENNSSAVADEALNDPSLRKSLIALGLDPTTGRQEGRLRALGVDYQHARVDSLIDTTRGYQVAVHVEESGWPIPATFDYRGFSADARQYTPLGNRVMTASQVQGGTLTPADSDPGNIPFARKFFLGGASTV